MNVRAFVYGVLLAASTLAIASPQDGPQTKKSVSPAYPEILKRAGIEGEVFIKAVINEQGFVEKAEVIKTTNKDFNEATIDAAKKWEFIPASKEGKPIKAEVTIPFRFRLEGKSDGTDLKDGKKLRKNVEQILNGTVTESLLSMIDPEASLVAGGKYENLRIVLSDSKKRKSYLNIPVRNILNSHLKTDASESSAFLVLTVQGASSKAKIYHTIVSMKSASGDWRIQAWHTSQ